MGQLTGLGPEVWHGDLVCPRCGGPAVYAGEWGASELLCLAYAQLDGPGCPGAPAGEAARLVVAALAETPGAGVDGDPEVVTDPEPELWTRRRVLREVADLVEAGLPAPMTVGLHQHASGRGLLTLRLDDEAPGDVDGWAPRLGLPAAAFEGRIDSVPRPFRPYKAAGCWPGWRVEVWCAVHEPPAEPADSGVAGLIERLGYWGARQPGAAAAGGGR